jgi:A/G-specific adenine glycosylase
LDWAKAEQRDLPWRRTRDPWSVLVSELMLQQTQVERVEPKYEAFLSAYPTPEACATASLGEIVTAWAGLGYNRRALNLHRCAQIIVASHGGQLPSDLAGLLALPGIGPYTARAVLAFAFEADVGVVDTNAARVLARMGSSRLRPREAQDAADAAVPAGTGWAWNQAMLDLGATRCRARSPHCGDCPVRRWCGWQGRGDDPAVGSAGVSGRQSAFEGSHRQGRGRLVDALRRDGRVEHHELATVTGWPGDPERARAAAQSLVDDGLASWDGRALVFSSR